jgi:hypothetical protein
MLSFSSKFNWEGSRGNGLFLSSTALFTFAAALHRMA